MCTLWFGEKDRQAYLYWRWQCHWPRRQIGIGSWNGFNWILSQGYNLTKLNKSTKEISDNILWICWWRLFVHGVNLNVNLLGLSSSSNFSFWVSLFFEHILGLSYSSNIFWIIFLFKHFWGLFSSSLNMLSSAFSYCYQTCLALQPVRQQYEIQDFYKVTKFSCSVISYQSLVQFSSILALLKSQI